MKRYAFVAVLMFIAQPVIAALQPGPNDVYIRVVDAGAGLCTVTEVPGEHYMVYDGGHWTGSNCLQAVRDIVDGGQIDLLIISHSDADHLGEAIQRVLNGTLLQILQAVAEQLKMRK